MQASGPLENTLKNRKNIHIKHSLKVCGLQFLIVKTKYDGKLEAMHSICLMVFSACVVLIFAICFSRMDICVALQHGLSCDAFFHFF